MLDDVSFSSPAVPSVVAKTEAEASSTVKLKLTSVLAYPSQKVFGVVYVFLGKISKTQDF